MARETCWNLISSYRDTAIMILLARESIQILVGTFYEYIMRSNIFKFH